MSERFAVKLVSMAEAEGIREKILMQMPPDVRSRVAACIRKEKAFQIAAADHYLRHMAAEEGLGTTDTIRVGHEESGKPFLISGGARMDLHVSVSHSDGYLCLCLADIPAGCDVEKIRHVPVHDALKGFFSEADLKAVRASDKPDTLLTRIWTRREAFAKLTGITQGLRRISFHDRETVGKERGILFTEGQEEEYLFTVVRYDDT